MGKVGLEPTQEFLFEFIILPPLTKRVYHFRHFPKNLRTSEVDRTSLPISPEHLLRHKLKSLLFMHERG